MFCVEAADLVQFDVGILGPAYGTTSNPPLGTG